MLYKAINVSNGVILADKLKIARTWRDRSVGLLNRDSLGAGEALFIEPCSSIHTFFMKFSIDVLFLGSGNEVVKIVKNIKPWRLSGCLFGALGIIEFPTGVINDSKVSLKNIIKIEKVT